MSSRENIDPILEGLTETQLKDTIIRLVKDISTVKQDAKNFAKSCRETVKEKEERIEECLELLAEKALFEVNA